MRRKYKEERKRDKDVAVNVNVYTSPVHTFLKLKKQRPSCRYMLRKSYTVRILVFRHTGRPIRIQRVILITVQ